MPNTGDPSSPVVNPIVRDLLHAGGNALAVGGYVGPAKEGSVRLYRDLSLTKYIEIPTDDVVRIVQDTKAPEKFCIVFFKSTAEVTYVQTASVRAERVVDAMAAAASQPTGCNCSSAAARQSGGGGPVPSVCTWSCVERYQLCVAGDDSWSNKFWCAYDAFFCLMGCDGPITV